VDDLIAWLRAALDDEGRIAQAALDEAVAGDPSSLDDQGRLVIGDRAVNVWATAHLGRWHPRRALAEVEAKRRILDLHAASGHDCMFGLDGDAIHGYADHENPEYGPCDTVKLLALPYAALPGYRTEWGPQ